MKLNLKPGMRLKNRSGDNVEILKTDFNLAFGAQFSVLAIVEDESGAQSVCALSPEGRAACALPGVDSQFDLLNPYDDLKDGDPVFVRNSLLEEEWRNRHFCRFEGEAVVCYQDGKTRWTFNPAFDTLTRWAEVRIPTEEELKTGKPIDAPNT